MKLRSLSLGLLGSTLLATASGHATVLDAGFTEAPFVSGIKQLTSMAWAPDGSNRLFVLQKTGEVLIVQDGTLLATPFATLKPIVAVSECGLLGVAFDPNFLDNGYVYFFVTVSTTEQQIVRYTAQGNVGADKTLIVGGLPTKGINHDGGALGFGADGKLYWAIGDTAGARSGIDGDLESLAAKVGRANSDGSAPSDNPFFDGPGPNNDFIWARGFRNPFTLTFQPSTGRLWLNVVGLLVEQVFTPVAGDNGGWDDYEGNQPAGYISPLISYWTNKAPSFVITKSGAMRSGGVVTITTAVAHRLRPGAKVTIAGVTDQSFDGSAFIEAVEPNSFSFAQAGADAKSGSGTASLEAIGGALTGGAFWESTAIPAAYRGNFFFGDYNSGAVTRAELDASNHVTAVRPFATGITEIVDMAVGPDGALYYGSNPGSIYRTSFDLPAQSLLVSDRYVRLIEGGRAAFNVRLATAPAKNTIAKVSLVAGDDDVTVVEGDTLTFTPANWAAPQRVVLSAAVDADAAEDTAQVEVSSTGLVAQTVEVRVTDVQSSGGGGGEGGGSDLGGGGVAGADASNGGVSTSGGASPGSGGAPSTGEGQAGAAFEEPSGTAGESDAAGGAKTGSASTDASGCGCRTAGGDHSGAWTFVAGLGLLADFARRRRRRAKRLAR